GVFKGKPSYAAPEVITGASATAISDLFSLGIVLYELLAGRHPFGDGAGDPMSIALAITQHEPPPLTDVPAPLAAIVSRALAKAPEARFPRPEDMAEALSRYLAQAGEPASSQALAAFLASLNLPPTLLELSESSAQPGSDPGGQARTRQSPVLPTRPVDPPSFALEIEEFDDVPGGPALSMSGRLVMPTAAAPAPVTEPRAPLRSVMDMKEEELQLTERAPRPQSDFVPIDTAEPRPRRRWGRTVALVAIPLLVLAGVVVALPQFSQQLRTLRLPHGSGAPMGMLSIQSEPAGATVTVDGTVLGKTPLAVDNTYPAQDIPVKVTLKGYKPWTGTFTGGEPVSLDVKLRK
ncbi:PEGA domain-containing protein, partial [Archangium sp.]|uniref:PEGA domain-containing protein n=1 Tax=Archangium sp. TaxID=1872627 RepID=UPI002EDAD936